MARRVSNSSEDTNMSVNELQALAKQFADPIDQRDLKTFLGMLSDDLEVSNHSFHLH